MQLILCKIHKWNVGLYGSIIIAEDNSTVPTSSVMVTSTVTPTIGSSSMTATTTPSATPTATGNTHNTVCAYQ